MSLRPDQYEILVANHFKEIGYSITVSTYTNDYGVDVFATKENEKIAVQAKMFGATSRKINRQMVMELHGAKDYFDCSKAVIATNGTILENAKEVANKLGIEILKIPAVNNFNFSVTDKPAGKFESIWQKYVMQLEGKTLQRSNGGVNKVVKVDWAGIERVTSNGRSQRIKIEIFKKTINHIIKHGSISRKLINEEYKGRASSGIVLILSNTEIFDLTKKPTGLKLNAGKLKI